MKEYRFVVFDAELIDRRHYGIAGMKPLAGRIKLKTGESKVFEAPDKLDRSILPVRIHGSEADESVGRERNQRTHLIVRYDDLARDRREVQRQKHGLVDARVIHHLECVLKRRG